MADLDVELANRLSRLAAAVPLSQTRLDPVHRGAVEARQRVRMAWLTPLFLLVVIVIGSTLVGGRGDPGRTADPTAGSSPSAPNHVVHASTRSGDFQLEIQSDKAWYLPGEPIQIQASLTYVGPHPTIRITHGFGSPMSFGILEPVNGLDLSPRWRLSCDESDLTRDVPLERTFVKTGGFSGDHPKASEFDAFFSDPLLTLPVGVWHPFVQATFSIGDCGGSASVRAEIEIEVVPHEPNAPSSSPGAVGERWTSSVVEGDFELVLEAAKGTFSTDEPLAVAASLVYRGPDGQVVIHYMTWGPLGFDMWAPGVTLSPRGRWDCSDLEMERGVPFTEALLDLGNGGTRFAVPHGLYEITVIAQFMRGSCSAPADTMETSIVVAVADGPDDIPLFTDLASEQTACLLMRNGGRLALSETGLGVVDSQEQLRQVIWPAGYTARRMPKGGAALVDRDGLVVAYADDQVLFDALTPADGRPLRPCGEVQAAD